MQNHLHIPSQSSSAMFNTSLHSLLFCASGTKFHSYGNQASVDFFPARPVFLAASGSGARSSDDDNNTKNAANDNAETTTKAQDPKKTELDLLESKKSELEKSEYERIEKIVTGENRATIIEKTLITRMLFDSITVDRFNKLQKALKTQFTEKDGEKKPEFLLAKLEIEGEISAETFDQALEVLEDGTPEQQKFVKDLAAKDINERVFLKKLEENPLDKNGEKAEAKEKKSTTLSGYEGFGDDAATAIAQDIENLIEANTQTVEQFMNEHVGSAEDHDKIREKTRVIDQQQGELDRIDGDINGIFFLIARESGKNPEEIREALWSFNKGNFLTENEKGPTIAWISKKLESLGIEDTKFALRDKLHDKFEEFYKHNQILLRNVREAQESMQEAKALMQEKMRIDTLVRQAEHFTGISLKSGTKINHKQYFAENGKSVLKNTQAEIIGVYVDKKQIEKTDWYPPFDMSQQDFPLVVVTGQGTFTIGRFKKWIDAIDGYENIESLEELEQKVGFKPEKDMVLEWDNWTRKKNEKGEWIGPLKLDPEQVKLTNGAALIKPENRKGEGESGVIQTEQGLELSREITTQRAVSAKHTDAEQDERKQKMTYGEFAKWARKYQVVPSYDRAQLEEVLGFETPLEQEQILIPDAVQALPPAWLITQLDADGSGLELNGEHFTNAQFYRFAQNNHLKILDAAKYARQCIKPLEGDPQEGIQESPEYSEQYQKALNHVMQYMEAMRQARGDATKMIVNEKRKILEERLTSRPAKSPIQLTSSLVLPAVASAAAATTIKNPVASAHPPAAPTGGADAHAPSHGSSVKSGTSSNAHDEHEKTGGGPGGGGHGGGHGGPGGHGGGADTHADDHGSHDTAHDHDEHDEHGEHPHDEHADHGEHGDAHDKKHGDDHGDHGDHGGGGHGDGAHGEHGDGHGHGEHEEGHDEHKIEDVYTPSTGYMSKLWQQTTFISGGEVWHLMKSVWEYYLRWYKRQSEGRYSNYGKDLPVIGSEMLRLKENTEHHEVGTIKEAMQHMGPAEVQHLLHEAKNKDQLKACIEVLVDKGYMNWYDIHLWQNLNRHLPDHLKIPYDTSHNHDPYKHVKIEPGTGKPLTGFDFLKPAIDALWTDNQFNTWMKGNLGNYGSQMDGFSEKYKQMENDPNNNGGLKTHLQMMLKKKLDGQWVDAHEYEGLIRFIIDNGKCGVEDKFYYTVLGVASGILTIERLGALDGTYLNRMPWLDWIVDRGDKKPYQDEAGPYTTTQLQELAKYLLNDPTITEDKNKYGPGRRTREFMWEKVFTHEKTIVRTMKGLRNAKDVDHEDSYFTVPIVSEKMAETVTRYQSGAVQMFTTEGYLNSYSGFSEYMKVNAKLAAKGENKNASATRLMKCIRSFVRYDGILDGRCYPGQANYVNLGYDDYNRVSLVDGVPVIDHQRQMNNTIIRIGDAYGYNWRTMFEKPDDDGEKKKVAKAIERFAREFQAAIDAQGVDKMLAVVNGAQLFGTGDKILSDEEKKKLLEQSQKLKEGADEQ